MKNRSLKHFWKHRQRISEIINAMKVTPQWQDLTMAYLGFKPLSFPFKFETRKGQQLVLNTQHDLVTIWVIFFRDEYPIPREAKVIIDAGANIGSFSLLAVQNNPSKLFAIEPFPETFAQLESNIKLNGLEQKVTLKKMALAEETGMRRMDLTEAPSQSRGLIQDDDERPGVEVQIQTLKDFMADNNLENVDLLKIDIEGGEHDVFHSSDNETLQKIKHIAMEYHPNRPKKDLFEKIVSAQFRLVKDTPISDNSGIALFERSF
ncbi:MAG: FkbM family methyltransferase [Bdellovibrionales bacterium]|nr:FkbM family methyltransferase [Bdellovibrionales bacterium]NQZ19284.1 FkbM family methyltransferase [Bdellovibrionales bacterium]